MKPAYFGGGSMRTNVEIYLLLSYMKGMGCLYDIKPRITQRTKIIVTRNPLFNGDRKGHKGGGVHPSPSIILEFLP